MRRTLIFTVLVLALLAAACSTAGGTPAPAPTTASAVEQAAEPTKAPQVEPTQPVEAAPEGDLDALTASPWMWTAFTDPIQQFDVEAPENYTLNFLDDGAVEIKADCNNARGTYTAEGSSIQIEVGPMTRAMCPPDSRSDEFIKYLGSAAIYFFKDSNLHFDLMADGGTMAFAPAISETSSGAGTARAQNPGNAQLTKLGIDVNAEPFSGELYLGGGEERWLNPTLISTLGGTSEGPGINAADLGPGCNFFIPFRPDVTVHWDEQEDAEALRFFFLSTGDPSLVLVTPSGEVICNDDLNPLVLDPFIEITDPEPGRYLAFLGTYENEAVYPGFLVVTTHSLNPATMDLLKLFPRKVDPRGIPQKLSLDLLELDLPEVAQPAGGQLSPPDLPYTSELTAGGEIGAFNLDQPNQLCTGFISAAPSFRFKWTGDSNPLVMFFESNVDTALLVRAPDGTFTCDDDFNGSENINPGLTITSEQGIYRVWVGSFSPDVQAEGVLTITDDANAAPIQLTSQDIQ